MQALYQKFLTARKKVDAEDFARSKIIYSDPYVDLNVKIQALRAEQEAMLEGLPDSTAEYDAAKREMIEAMKAEGRSSFETVSARFKEKKEVNRIKVLNVIGGDLDAYISISNISQVALKDFCKGNPLKNELMECVEVTEREIIDLEIFPSAA